MRPADGTDDGTEGDVVGPLGSGRERGHRGEEPSEQPEIKRRDAGAGRSSPNNGGHP